MIYLIHPESCCAFVVDTEAAADKIVSGDPLVKKVSKEEYLKACDAWGEEVDPRVTL